MAISIRIGSALACLRAMPADSVHCVVTSPPYWGLRDYGTPPQTTALVADRLGRDCIGIELSPAYAAMAKRRTGASPPKVRAPAKLRPAA